MHFSGRDRALPRLTARICVCLSCAPEFSALAPSLVWGPFFFQKSPLCCLGQSFSHVSLGTKKEVPPTQLAASHVYLSQCLLAYTFRAASRPGRGAKRGRESLFLRARARFLRPSRGAGTSHPPTPSFLAAPAALQQAILYLCDDVSVVCGLWGWSVSVCAVACVEAPSRLSAA